MLKGALIATVVTLAVAVVATAAPGPAAMADAPKCKNKANKYVACTDKLKAVSPRRAPDVDGRDFLIWQRGPLRSKTGKLKN